jgi:hypothetical protein
MDEDGRLFVQVATMEAAEAPADGAIEATEEALKVTKSLTETTQRFGVLVVREDKVGLTTHKSHI